MAHEEQPEQPGLTRREALRRTAAVGGALVWTVPVVQSLSGTAVAATGSTAVGGTKTGNKPPKEKPPTEVLGTKLPRTGSIAGDLAALGVGTVAVGAAMRAVKKSRGEGGDASPPPPSGRHGSA
jgi:hypothetical protein